MDKRKSYTCDLSVNPGERSVVAKISTAAIDRDGEVMVPSGCITTDFEKSGTVFYNHDYDRPIGKCVSIKRNQYDIEAKTVFASRPENHVGEWLPDTVFSLFQQDVIKGFSVGFKSVEYRPATKGDIANYGPGCTGVYSKWKMMEYSVAPLPCNQDALSMAVSKGVLTAIQCKSLFGVEPEIKPIIPKSVIPPEPKRKRIVVMELSIQDVPEKVNIDFDALVKQAIDKATGKLYTV